MASIGDSLSSALNARSRAAEVGIPSLKARVVRCKTETLLREGMVLIGAYFVTSYC